MEFVLVFLFFVFLGYIWEKLKEGGGRVVHPNSEATNEETAQNQYFYETNCPHCQKPLHVDNEDHWRCEYCQGEFIYYKQVTYKREDIHSLYAAYSLACIAKFCKLDGKVTEDELAIVEENMRQFWQPTLSELTGLKRLFNQEIKNINDFEATLTGLYDLVKDDPKRKMYMGQFLLDTMYRISTLRHSFDTIHPKHREVIYKVMGMFDLTEEFFTHFVQNNERTIRLEQAYELLQCDKDASEKEIKKRYRELSKKYHPDMLNAKDLPPEITELAAEKFKEITEAYRCIMDHLKYEQRKQM